MTIHLTDTITLSDRDIQERFLRVEGARGQNTHHDATAVELQLDVAHVALPAEVAARLTLLAGRRMTPAGVLVVASRAFKSQAANREAARTRLLSLLLRAAREPKVRKPTHPRRAEREQRLAEKHIQSGVKQGRRHAFAMA